MLDFCHLHKHQGQSLELRTRGGIELPSFCRNLVDRVYQIRLVCSVRCRTDFSCCCSTCRNRLWDEDLQPRKQEESAGEGEKASKQRQEQDIDPRAFLHMRTNSRSHRRIACEPPPGVARGARSVQSRLPPTTP